MREFIGHYCCRLDKASATMLRGPFQYRIWTESSQRSSIQREFFPREFSVGFPRIKTRMFSISCYLHSQQFVSPLLESIDQGEHLLLLNRVVPLCRSHNSWWIDFKVSAIKMFLIQHSPNGLARRVSLDSCRQARIMMLQDGLAQQPVSHLNKSMFMVRLVVTTSVFCKQLGPRQSTSSKTWDESSVEVHKSPGMTFASPHFSGLASSLRQWSCLGGVGRHRWRWNVPKTRRISGRTCILPAFHATCCLSG